MTAKTTGRRRRGGQPGNQNAARHGFYSAAFEEEDSEALEAEMAEGLRDEISMLRVITRRVLKLSRGTEDLDESMILLDSMGMAAIRLASLLRAQKMLGGDTDKTSAAISEALSGLIEEIRKDGRRVNKA